jgi:ABC-2 type transport system ATP-binding protein
LDLDPWVENKELKNRIGVQLQTPALFDKLTVTELLNLFASFYSNPLRVNDVIEMVGLSEKAKTLSMKLSGGQLQRLSVALALISNGETIFLDEPTTGLDPQSRRGLWDVIEKIKAEGRTVFLTTHYMDEAERLCDRVAIIDQGKIIAMGTPRELVQTHFAEQALEFVIKPEQAEIVKNILPASSRLELEGELATVYTKEVPEAIEALLSLTGNGFRLARFTVRSATLEDVFLKLTGRRIRE